MPIASAVLLLTQPDDVRGRELSEVPTAVDRGSLDGLLVQSIEIDDDSRMVMLLIDGTQVGAHYPKA